MYNIVPARHFSLIKPYTFQKLTRKVRSERWETYTRIFAMRWETENNEVGNGHMRWETDAWGGKRLLETSEKKSTILIAYSPHIFSCTSNLFFCEYTSTAPLHVNCHSWGTEHKQAKNTHAGEINFFIINFFNNFKILGKKLCIEKFISLLKGK